MMNHFTFNDNVGPNFTVSLAVKHYLHVPPRRRRVAAVSVEQQQAAAKATFRECTMPRLFLKCGTSTGGAPEAADAVGAQPPGVRRGIQHVEGEAAGTRARPRAAPRPVRVRAAVRCRGAGGGGGGEGEAGTRRPWHDMRCRLDGPASYDVVDNFEQRWRKTKRLRLRGVLPFGEKAHWMDCIA
ncbi:hypothetical protein PVAP13_6KG259300 [Panicum virgatum]|uniref:Uncharacterized protein n=1 Tax=Panicum virgatum TaxID=38727 RepID=A0A8T0RBK9_PANVG|nr:hypothetical protein PVAP13_6KG259300 [Panicum virgatum]